MMESNYAAERATVAEIQAGDGRRPTVPNPKDLLARKLEVNGNALYALSMLLKMADEDRLYRLSELDDTSPLYEPIGHLVGILSDEVINAANEAGAGW